MANVPKHIPNREALIARWGVFRATIGSTSALDVRIGALSEVGLASPTPKLRQPIIRYCQRFMADCRTIGDVEGARKCLCHIRKTRAFIRLCRDGLGPCI